MAIMQKPPRLGIAISAIGLLLILLAFRAKDDNGLVLIIVGFFTMIIGSVVIVAELIAQNVAPRLPSKVKNSSRVVQLSALALAVGILLFALLKKFAM